MAGEIRSLDSHLNAGEHPNAADVETQSRSSFPFGAVAASIALLAVGLYGIFFRSSPSAGSIITQRPLAPETTQAKPAPILVSNVRSPAPSAQEPVAAETVTAEIPKPEQKDNDAVIADSKEVPESASATSSEIPHEPTIIPAAEQLGTDSEVPLHAAVTSATTAEAEQSADPTIQSQINTLNRAKAVFEAANRAHDELEQSWQKAESEASKTRKALAERQKTLASPAENKAEADTAKRKALDAVKIAEVAFEKARKLAEEKAKELEAAKKVVAEIDAQSRAKVEDQQMAARELEELKKVVTENERIAAEAAKKVTEKRAERELTLTAMRNAENQLRDAKTAADEAERKRVTAEQEERMKVEAAKQLEVQIEEMRKQLDQLRTAPPAPVAPQTQNAVTISLPPVGESHPSNKSQPLH
jgi:hypothetical protein